MFVFFNLFLGIQIEFENCIFADRWGTFVSIEYDVNFRPYFTDFRGPNDIPTTRYNEILIIAKANSIR